MDYVTLASHAVRQYAPDQIFTASQRAKADAAALGEDAVINATLGECLDDDGKLMVLPTVERMIRQMPVEDICSYAPIAGIKGFNEAVQISLFGKCLDRFYVESVATPGGCGALRHAIWNFLNFGDALLTTKWIWGPYKNICEEHGRRMVTFDMFNRENTFNLEGMDRAIGEILAVQEQLLMILNTPANNPTGYSMTKQEMEQTVAILKKHAAANPDKNLTFCLDVSYIDFAGSFEESREIFDAIFDMPANTMTLLIFSMSKSYTMCGMRCGALVCLGSTAESAAVFKQAMSYSSRSTWSNAIHMAQKILVDINLNPEIRERVSQERAVFRNTITNRGRTFCAAAKEASLEICPYQYGYFVAIPCKNPVETARILMDQHIYVVPQAQGLRFSPCTVTTEKCRKAPAFIKAAMEQTQ